MQLTHIITNIPIFILNNDKEIGKKKKTKNKTLMTCSTNYQCFKQATSLASVSKDHQSSVTKRKMVLLLFFFNLVRC